MRATQLLLGVDSAVSRLSSPLRGARSGSDPRRQGKEAARIRRRTKERQVLEHRSGRLGREACSHPETSPKDTCLLPNSWARGPSWEEKKKRREGAAGRRRNRHRPKAQLPSHLRSSTRALSLSSCLSSSESESWWHLNAYFAQANGCN